ncbi:MAG TPA: hypothetical protein VMT53_04215 [Terriglobales bacterium]|nr:hypothetical protein [Terriglobales bacterium]
MITNTATKSQAWPMLCRCALLMTTFAMLSPICRAQQEPSFDSAVEVVRADERADRATLITATMKFNDKEAAAFWPIYRRYEHERSLVDDGRVAIIKEYTQKFPNFSDAEAKSMAERMFQYDARLAALRKTYYKKFNKVLPALTVTKFFQLDRRIDLLMDMRVESTLPPLTQPQDNGSGGND